MTRRRVPLPALGCLALASLDCGPVSSAEGTPTMDAAAPIEVPLTVNDRLIASVNVGGITIDAIVDTGSAGLRILGGALPDSAFAQITDLPVTYSYSTDLIIRGVMAYATVSLGAAKTTVPVPVMIIQTPICVSTVYTCDPETTLADHFSSLSSGIPAILGVGMRTPVGGQGIGNPIVQMPGHPPFVVHMGDLASTLRIGALPSDPSTFQTIALGPDALAVPLLDGSPSWSDVVPSCFSVEGTDADYCASALVDTGTPEMFAELPAGPEPTLALMPTGVPVHVTVGEPGDVVATYTFVAGDSFVPPPNVFVVTRSAGAFSVLGTPAFQPFDVLFDQSQGLIGFAPQPPSP